MGGSSTTSRSATRLPCPFWGYEKLVAFSQTAFKLTFRWGGEKKSQTCLPSSVPPPSLRPLVFVVHPFSFSCYSSLVSSLIPGSHFAILFHSVLSPGVSCRDALGSQGGGLYRLWPRGIFLPLWVAGVPQGSVGSSCFTWGSRHALTLKIQVIKECLCLRGVTALEAGTELVLGQIRRRK